MSFKMIKEYQNKQKEFYKHCRDIVINRYESKKPLTLAEYVEFTKDGINSYEMYLLTEIAPTEIIVELIRQSLANSMIKEKSKYELAENYDDWIVNYLIHKL